MIWNYITYNWINKINREDKISTVNFEFEQWIVLCIHWFESAQNNLIAHSSSEDFYMPASEINPTAGTSKLNDWAL